MDYGIQVRCRRKIKGDPITMSGKIRDLIRASTGEGFGQVPEKVSGKYRKMVEFWQVPKKGPGEYRKMVESGRVL